jgi:hypothetical protein
MTSERIEIALCDASDRAADVSEYRYRNGRRITDIIRASVRAARLTTAAARRWHLAVTAASGPVVAERRVLN